MVAEISVETQLTNILNNMDSEIYYEIIPKDNDPEVAEVLDFITNRAKTQFNYKEMSELFNPIVDPDFFLFQCLIVINQKKGKEKLLGETFNEFIFKGFMMELEQLKTFMSEIEDKCKLEAFAMGMAADLMFHQGWRPSDVLINIKQLLNDKNDLKENNMTNYSNLEEQVKDLIRKSLYKHIEGIGRIDDIYSNDNLVNDIWLTDIMALGFNESNFEAAAQDIYEIQKPMMGTLVPVKSIEEYRARVYLTYNRFSSEVMAFERYVELRDTESEEAVLFAVREELEGVEEGDFELF